MKRELTLKHNIPFIKDMGRDEGFHESQSLSRSQKNLEYCAVYFQCVFIVLL